MQHIKINDIEIEYEDGLTLSIEDNGKRIVIKGRSSAVEHHWHFAPVPIYPYIPTWIIQPVNPLPYGTPIVTCDVSSSVYQTTGNEQVSFTNKGLLT